MTRGSDENGRRARILSAVLAMALASGCGAAVADEVETAIQEALTAYKQKDFGAAAESLDYATQLIRQQKGSQLEQFLPDPLSGWTAEEAESAAAGTAFFGGGVSAQRVYTQGDKRITVSLVTDSPLMQSMMMMFSNPMFATSDGGKMQRINGQKAIVKYTSGDKQGEVRMVVSNTLVTVEGNADEADLVGYAQKINVKGLGSN